MKKKLIAVVMALALLFTVATPATAATVSTPPIDDIVTALQADLHDEAQASGTVMRLSLSLLRALTERAMNTEVTVEDMAAFIEEASQLMLSIYNKLGARAAEMLKPRDDGKPDDSQPGTPSQPSDPGTGNPGQPTEPKPDEPDEPETTQTFASLSDLMKKYIFIKVDDPGQIAALIAESCEFKYTTLRDGNGTVYIRVNIEENPQIFNYAVFRSLVEDLYARQGEELLQNEAGETDYLMSYEHIAGELALHAILYAASGEMLRLGVNSGRLLSMYRSAAIADLNATEARLPTEVFAIIGSLLINFVHYNLLRVFGLL